MNCAAFLWSHALSLIAFLGVLDVVCVAVDGQNVVAPWRACMFLKGKTSHTSPLKFTFLDSNGARDFCMFLASHIVHLYTLYSVFFTNRIFMFLKKNI